MFYNYEDTNLKTYAGSKLENCLLFKHPEKTHVKDALDFLVSPYMPNWTQPQQLNNPFV